jgi:O-antigen ligase
MFKHDPVIGVGLYNFPSVYAQFAGYGSRFVGFYKDAHNLYFAVATELGIVGLVVLLAAIISELREVTKVYRANMEPDPILVACEAACFGVLVAACFVNAWWYKAFWLPWILLAHAIRGTGKDGRAAELLHRMTGV